VLVEGGSHHNTNAVGQPLYREAVAELFGLRPPADSERLAQGAAPARN
jgi:hypothetical protein